jgi:hypothetical protein
MSWLHCCVIGAGHTHHQLQVCALELVAGDPRGHVPLPAKTLSTLNPRHDLLITFLVE